MAALSFLVGSNLLFALFLYVAIGQPIIQTNDLRDGLIALRDGKLAEAKTSLEAVIKQDPENAIAWASLAETCFRLGENSRANEAAQKAEQFGGTQPAIDHALASFYAQQAEFGHAAKLEERYAASAKADFQAPLRAAELYQRAGDRVGAERVLKEAWTSHANDPVVAFTYARVLLEKLDFADAEKVIAQAREAHPKDPQLILVSGVAKYGERRFAAAMDDFLAVIAVDPTIPQPYEFLGKMLEQAGPKLPQIAKAFEARLKTAPEDALANLVLAKARLMNDAKDPEAEALLRHSLAVDPEQWEAHYQLGVLLESKRDYKAAAEELKRSVELDAGQAMPHYHLARVYDRLGEPEKARAERTQHEALSNIPK